MSKLARQVPSPARLGPSAVDMPNLTYLNIRQCRSWSSGFVLLIALCSNGPVFAIISLISGISIRGSSQCFTRVQYRSKPVVLVQSRNSAHQPGRHMTTHFPYNGSIDFAHLVLQPPSPTQPTDFKSTQSHQPSSIMSGRGKGGKGLGK
jgi:hypothetical protein